MLPASGGEKDKRLASTSTFFLAACTGRGLWSRLYLRPNLLQYRRPITKLPELIKQAIHLCEGKETSSFRGACPPSACRWEEWRTRTASGEREEARGGVPDTVPRIKQASLQKKQIGLSGSQERTRFQNSIRVLCARSSSNVG